MNRTTIMLPGPLRTKADKTARQMDVSLGELIRLALIRIIDATPKNLRTDPLFADNAVFKGCSPSDSASNHDYYLYGEDP
ncbi:MAG: hypothetical protein HQM16_05290 [Deltaproteobacteria bacterium]|nr:hypothetical protein [Deltaproteobacteria bacterium]